MSTGSGAWISGIHTVPHASFNQGTKCTCKDTGREDTCPGPTQPGHRDTGLHPSPQCYRRRKPHGALVIAASGHSPGALLLPRVALKTPRAGAHYPCPVTALDSPGPPYPGQGAPSLTQLTLVTWRRLSRPQLVPQGRETNQVSDSQAGRRCPEQLGAGSRDGGLARTAADTQTPETDISRMRLASLVNQTALSAPGRTSNL